MRALIANKITSEVQYSDSLKFAVRMIDAGKIPLREIAEYSALPLETVNHLAAQRAALG